MYIFITMSNELELRHLRYFLTVSEELHFSKSAEKLFITQPALSRQIRQLEQILGTDLFLRDKRNVTLTEAGEYLKDEAQFIFNHLGFVKNNLQHIEAGEEGELRIGFVGSAMQSVIPGLLTRFHDSSPKVRTVLTELSNQDQIDQIRKDELDIGFIRTMRLPSGLQKKNIYEETFSLVLPKHHSLDQTSFKTVAQLKEEPFILFSSDYSHGYFDKIMSIFEDKGFAPKVAHQSVHANTIFRLVENNLGVGIVPTSLTRGFDLNIKFIELTKIRQRTTLSVIWKQDSRNALLKNILKLLPE
ncbi:MAG: LysR family transcriptional regulator [Balneolales bacterium]|nr:LysR family transcriptional regulator [Balneolales bacterium]